MALDLKNVFDSMPVSVEQVFTIQGRCYYVPAYQRPYAWDKNNVQQLITNICEGLGTLRAMVDAITFIGSFIFIHDRDYKTVEPKARNELPASVFLVIDGQQRLSTVLLLVLVLHEQFTKESKVRRKLNDELSTWIDQQCNELMARLFQMLAMDNYHGEEHYRQYPRIVRAFVDQWGRTKASARYRSPLASMLSQYIQFKANPDAKEFSFDLSELNAEDAEVKRFDDNLGVIRRAVRALVKGKPGGGDDDGVLPSLEDVTESAELQARFFQTVPDPVVVNSLRKQDEPQKHEKAAQEFARLVMFTRYLLERVVVTEVRVGREEYAFDMFESLNTTGEPLTAYETFRPQVIHREGLASYDSSPSKHWMTQIEAYINSVENQRAIASNRLIVPFALFESGEKLGKQLRDQRNWLRRNYEECKGIDAQRDFVKGMADVAAFLGDCVPESRGIDASKDLTDIPFGEQRDVTLLALEVLRSTKHTITVACLSRFYAAYRDAKDNSSRVVRAREFSEAILAVVAFFALWRASRVGTDNIDQVYRRLMQSGGEAYDVGVTPFKRRGGGVPYASALREVLRGALTKQLRSPSDLKAAWVDQSAGISLYRQSQELSKLILLLAAHDAVPDSARPGFSKSGRLGCNPALNLQNWNWFGEVEHVAPRSRSLGWREDLYNEDRTIDGIGNLTLLPRSENASISNRPWNAKRLYYRVLAAESLDDADKILDAGRATGVQLTRPSEDLLNNARLHPHIRPLAALPDDVEWSAELVDQRARHLLERGWTYMAKWLDIP